MIVYSKRLLTSRIISGVFLLLLCSCLHAHATAAQSSRATGSIKGKVRVESGGAGTNEGVKVVARQGDEDVAETTTNRKGEFVLGNLKPGVYAVVFRPGQGSVIVDNIDVQAGKTRSLRERTLPVDIGSIAFVRGSVFNSSGLSVAGARVELARVEADGRARAIGGYVTNNLGEFAFRVPPTLAKYRVTVRNSGGSPVSKEVEVDGAYVYRVALSLPAASSRATP
ncbi:MAG: carboxypeptidase-like regulatory domain-containing protein [Acidobacteriota bacterium]|nr:carboxypeptidase-like regulatory domain-containing protein [Acidobacteriota bacterium]